MKNIDMKKIIGACIILLATVSLQAQTKISKNSVVGKWTILAVEMKDMLYYNIDKDSVSISDKLKSQVPDPSQLSAVGDVIKSQMKMFTKMSFTFNADGTADMNDGMSNENAPATYKVDEEASTITTIDKDKKEQTLKADMVDGNLRFTIVQPAGEIQMTLKKVRS